MINKFIKLNGNTYTVIKPIHKMYEKTFKLLRRNQDRSFSLSLRYISERHLFLTFCLLINMYLIDIWTHHARNTLHLYITIIYTLSPLIKTAYCISDVSMKQPCYWKHLYVVCGGQPASTVQPCKCCCDSAQTFWPLSYSRVKAKVMLQDFLGQPPQLPSSKTP